MRGVNGVRRRRPAVGRRRCTTAGGDRAVAEVPPGHPCARPGPSVPAPSPARPHAEGQAPPAVGHATAVTSVVPAGTGCGGQVVPPSGGQDGAGPRPPPPACPTAVHSRVEGQATSARWPTGRQGLDRHDEPPSGLARRPGPDGAPPWPGVAPTAQQRGTDGAVDPSGSSSDSHSAGPWAVTRAPWKGERRNEDLLSAGRGGVPPRGRAGTRTACGQGQRGSPPGRWAAAVRRRVPPVRTGILRQALRFPLPVGPANVCACLVAPSARAPADTATMGRSRWNYDGTADRSLHLPWSPWPIRRGFTEQDRAPASRRPDGG